MTKQNSKLASARAWWRLAQKASYAGNDRQAERYRNIAEQKYRAYLRQKQFTDKLMEQQEHRLEKHREVRRQNRLEEP
jgi:hypothetical protein